MRFISAAAALLFIAGPVLAQDVKITEEKPGLLKQAKVTPEAATTTALARVPGGKLRSGEIEKEDGRLIYSLVIKVEGKQGLEEVNIDAMSGVVVGVEHEADPESKTARPAPKKP
jgi:uncharacterized membrane protein YkoI